MRAIVKGLVLCVVASAAVAQTPGVIVSIRAPRDMAPVADPANAFWKDVKGVFAEIDTSGKPLPDLRTEIRSRWTSANLYLLYTCPYQQLYLKPQPDTVGETNKLWDWDVAEAFLGSDFQNIKKYKEFEVSPQGEWVDLDIDRGSPRTEGGWGWNSGFKVATRVDREHHIWYAAMQIPWSSLDSRPAKAGLELRANLYRIEGPAPNRTLINWQPTHKPSFHIPEAFGILRLADQ